MGAKHKLKRHVCPEVDSVDEEADQLLVGVRACSPGAEGALDECGAEVGEWVGLVVQWRRWFASLPGAAVPHAPAKRFFEPALADDEHAMSHEAVPRTARQLLPAGTVRHVHAELSNRPKVVNFCVHPGVDSRYRARLKHVLQPSRL